VLVLGEVEEGFVADEWAPTYVHYLDVGLCLDAK
jgi:hypothetical protein